MQCEKNEFYRRDVLSDLHPCGILIMVTAGSYRTQQAKRGRYPCKITGNPVDVACFYLNPINDKCYLLERRIIASDISYEAQSEEVLDILINANQQIGQSFNTVILDKWSSKSEALQLFHKIEKNYWCQVGGNWPVELENCEIYSQSTIMKIEFDSKSLFSGKLVTSVSWLQKCVLRAFKSPINSCDPDYYITNQLENSGLEDLNLISELIERAKFILQQNKILPQFKK